MAILRKVVLPCPTLTRMMMLASVLQITELSTLPANTTDVINVPTEDALQRPTVRTVQCAANESTFLEQPTSITTTTAMSESVTTFNFTCQACTSGLGWVVKYCTNATEVDWMRHEIGTEPIHTDDGSQASRLIVPNKKENWCFYILCEKYGRMDSTILIKSDRALLCVHENLSDCPVVISTNTPTSSQTEAPNNLSTFTTNSQAAVDVSTTGDELRENHATKIIIAVTFFFTAAAVVAVIISVTVVLIYMYQLQPEARDQAPDPVPDHDNNAGPPDSLEAVEEFTETSKVVSEETDGPIRRRLPSIQIFRDTTEVSGEDLSNFTEPNLKSNFELTDHDIERLVKQQAPSIEQGSHQETAKGTEHYVMIENSSGELLCWNPQAKSGTVHHFVPPDMLPEQLPGTNLSIDISCV